MMQTQHTVIDSPLGELTLAANGDALTGLYFPHHRHAPTAHVLGRYVEPAAEGTPRPGDFSIEDET